MLNFKPDTDYFLIRSQLMESQHVLEHEVLDGENICVWEIIIHRLFYKWSVTDEAVSYIAF